MDNYTKKLTALALKLQEDQQAQLVAGGMDCEANMGSRLTRIKPGKKYDKVDVGGSGKLMIVKATGEIFGIKGYGVIHRGHAYGTLDTIADWYWGQYYPTKKST